MVNLRHPDNIFYAHAEVDNTHKYYLHRMYASEDVTESAAAYLYDR